jgi:hypothetical protein
VIRRSGARTRPGARQGPRARSVGSQSRRRPPGGRAHRVARLVDARGGRRSQARPHASLPAPWSARLRCRRRAPEAGLPGSCTHARHSCVDPPRSNPRPPGGQWPAKRATGLPTACVLSIPLPQVLASRDSSIDGLAQAPGRPRAAPPPPSRDGHDRRCRGALRAVPALPVRFAREGRQADLLVLFRGHRGDAVGDPSRRARPMSSACSTITRRGARSNRCASSRSASSSP